MDRPTYQSFLSEEGIGETFVLGAKPTSRVANFMFDSEVHRIPEGRTSLADAIPATVP